VKPLISFCHATLIGTLIRLILVQAWFIVVKCTPNLQLPQIKSAIIQFFSPGATTPIGGLYFTAL